MQKQLLASIDRIPNLGIYGKVLAVKGLLIEVGGIERFLSVGARCRVTDPDVLAEVVGFRDDRALLMPYANVEGVGPGMRVELVSNDSAVYPDNSWLGRVVNAMGEAMDGGPPMAKGIAPYRIFNDPPQAHERKRMKGKIDMGVRAMNVFLTCCRGQRLGIFAGSGVGKSILMSMLARNSQADVNVIGLIGERSRELQEFLEDDLGMEGIKRSVIVCATSSESALMRRQAAYLTLSVAEFFRDQGKEVLCMMDSVTRFAMAQREIGLSAGEPPTTKGYPPTVFAELPRLLERAGPGKKGQGDITGLFTVLVEGGDTDEPIADAVRGILDGHIILDRAIAERGRFPAINILRSVSRAMPMCNTDQENALVQTARRHLAMYEDMAELIRLGAYRKGTDPQVDAAMQYYPLIEEFVRQRKDEKSELALDYAALAKILGMAWGEG
jgi:flagellum-specific ATP synthase